MQHPEPEPPIPHDTIDIHTGDGVCPTEVFEPEGGGPWPGVLVFMDAHGIRPAMLEIAERLAAHGYVAALPDLYYRSGFRPPEDGSLFSDPAVRAHWTAQVLPTVSAGKVMHDVPAFLEHLDARPTVRRGAIATVGYCMGGRLSLAAAGHFPERVAAAASYHPGGLATDAPDSPHLLAPRMRARVYVGGAKEDRSFDDAQKARLDAALSAAGVEHTIETYDALHGFVPRDTRAHDAAAAARHWRTLLALLDDTLRGGPGAVTPRTPTAPA
ncbi:MAG: dienelactone hydrolase family protein [Gemmatimonadaceae bacterium]